MPTVRNIPAGAFGRHYGWRISAVEHRVRAGIYDGVEDAGTWYVLRGGSALPPAPPADDEAAWTPFPALLTSPLGHELPWPTARGPIGWTHVGIWAGGLLLAGSALASAGDWSVLGMGVGLLLWTTATVCGGLWTGVIRTIPSGKRAGTRSRPVAFWTTVALALVLLVAGGGCIAQAVPELWMAGL